MNTEDIFESFFYCAVVAVVFYLITDVAMYFENPRILWWYIVPLLMVSDIKVY